MRFYCLLLTKFVIFPSLSITKFVIFLWLIFKIHIISSSLIFKDFGIGGLHESIDKIRIFPCSIDKNLRFLHSQLTKCMIFWGRLMKIHNFFSSDSWNSLFPTRLATFGIFLVKISKIYCLYLRKEKFLNFWRSWHQWSLQIDW